MLRNVLATTILATALAAAAFAQPRTQGFGRTGTAWCNDGGNNDRASFCEVREETVSGVNPFDVDAGRNGGIRVRGWDRGDVLVRAKIVGDAETDAEARRVVSGVRIVTAGGNVRAEGPEGRGDANWSVSFEIQVPRTALLTLTTNNGGISIEDFQGTAKFRARNGGVSLNNVSGDIRGETTNGGVTIDLTGERWDGAGLDVETRNGGIRMTMPEHYSAALETGTTNGRVNIDFPVAVQGQFGRSVSATLGAGGAKIRAVTTNGGVTIRRR
jgi:putative adhesin